MLSEFHRHFMRVLAKHHVRFIIIGGQARHAHHGSSTNDLDIWADDSAGNLAALARALLDWSAGNPNHFGCPLTFPPTLRTNMSFSVPDACRAGYLNEAGLAGGIITYKTCVDILTSVEGMSFESYFERGTFASVDAATARMLAADDIEQVAAVRFDRERRFGKQARKCCSA